MRYKRHPKIIDQLFNTSEKYDDIYKHYAIQYTLDSKKRKEFVMHNGLLYLDLPVEARDDPYLSYRAFVQNSEVYPYIHRVLKHYLNMKRL